MKLISGTFENGCTVTIEYNNRYYVKLVYKNSIEIDGNLYYKKDLKFTKIS